MADASTDAQFEYQLLGHYGKLAVLYAGLLSTLHKIQTKPPANRPFEGRDGFVDALGSLHNHFFGVQRGQRPMQIRGPNKMTQRRLAAFLIDTHDRFVDSIGGSVPNELRSFRDKLRADESLAAQLNDLKLELTGHRPIHFPDTTAKHSNVVAPFLRFAAACLGQQAEHPSLPGIPAADEFALASEHSGLIETPGDSAWKKTGLFSIVREARGPYTSEKPDVNVIVRDLLWIRRRVGEDPSRRVSDDNNLGGDIGFYFSTFDGIVYEIRNLKIRNRMVMLYAISFMRSGAERSLCMYYPESVHDHPLHCTEGILMGTLRDEKRPGAWKVFIVRPDWNDLGTLDVRLSIYLDHLRRLGRQEYDVAVAKCFDFVSANNLIGVLYSRDWARQNPQLSLESTRPQFRTMLFEKRAQARRDQIFVGNRIDEALRNKLAAVSRSKSKVNVDGVMAVLHSVLTENWQLIEPAQLISSGYSPDEVEADPAAHDALKDFVRRDRVLAYTEYARQMKRSTHSGLTPTERRRKRASKS
jgi:hypothetical protein